jgi:hypothetical protein
MRQRPTSCRRDRRGPSSSGYSLGDVSVQVVLADADESTVGKRRQLAVAHAPLHGRERASELECRLVQCEQTATDHARLLFRSSLSLSVRCGADSMF